MYFIKKEVCTIMTVEYSNYAEYLLEEALINSNKELAKYDLAENSTYRQYSEIKDQITQLSNALAAIRAANDLPF